MEFFEVINQSKFGPSTKAALMEIFAQALAGRRPSLKACAKKYGIGNERLRVAAAKIHRRLSEANHQPLKPFHKTY